MCVEGTRVGLGDISVDVASCLAMVFADNLGSSGDDYGILLTPSYCLSRLEIDGGQLCDPPFKGWIVIRLMSGSYRRQGAGDCMICRHFGFCWKISGVICRG